MRNRGGESTPSGLRNLKFQIDCHDLSYFFKFMIIREKLIPHVFTGQNHILTHQMGTPMSRFPLPLLKIHVFGPKIRKFPKVGRVWGDPKSKFRSKIPFLKRSRLDLIFTKKLKTFQKKLTKFWHTKKKTGFFSWLVTSGREIFKGEWRTEAHGQGAGKCYEISYP